MRIGIISHRYPKDITVRTDAGIHIYDFAHALAKHASVYVFAPDWGGEKERDANVPVTWFPMGMNNRYNVYSNYTIFAAVRRAAIAFAKNNRIDFCLAAWAIPAGFLAHHIKQTLGIPYAVWALGSDIHTYARYPILRQLISRWLRNADIRFANSYFLRDEVRRLTGKDCCYLPVISDFPSCVRKRTTLGNNCQFLYVGRLEKVKGIDVAIDACKYLKDHGVLFHLAVIGDGSLRTILEQDVLKNGLKDCVRFVGNQGKDSIVQHMLNADCLVIPSRKESFPQVLLEAARVGLPSIVTDTGDCRGILSKYHCGILVEPGSPQQLAEAMIRYICGRRRLSVKFESKIMRFVKDFTKYRPETIFLEKLKYSGFSNFPYK